MRRVIAASATSNLGDGMALVAFPWIASIITREPLLIAAVGASVQLAWIGGPLIVGPLVDRSDRVRLVRASLIFQSVLAGLLGVIVFITIDTDLWTGALRGSAALVAIGGLMVAIILIGVAEVVRDVGTQAILPHLATVNQLDRANSRLLTAELVAGRFIGQPLGGALLTIGASVPVLLDSLSFLVSAILLRPLLSTGQDMMRPKVEASSAPKRRTMLRGMRWLWRNHLLRSMTLALAWSNLMSGIALSALVLYAQDVLHLDGPQYGLLVAAGAAGGTAGGLLAPRLTGLGPGRTAILGVAASAIAYGVTALGPPTPLVGLALFTLGAAVMPWSVSSRTLRQRITPPRLLGRVTAAHRTLNFGALPVGTLVGGLITSVAAERLPVEIAFTVPFGVAAVGMAALLIFALRQFRQY